MDVAVIGNHYVGEEIANKTLISYEGQNKFGHHEWKWRCHWCDAVYGPSTISHMKRSTRCNACSHRPEYNGRWLGYEKISGTLHYQYRADARKKGREWAVTLEEMWAQWLTQDGRCAYTGWQLEIGINASLDRIDNERGYMSDNIQWVHRDVNRMKSDFSEGYFVTLCRGVAGFSAGQF
jgi:hypothetical protein